MNNTEIAKKYGIIEKEYFSEECLKFYSKNDKELIEKEHNGINNLVNSGYSYDEAIKNYVKTNNTVDFEFDGKKYELFEYKDCFIYHIYICNEKTKKFRTILLSDYKDFDEDSIYIYKDKYFCQYYSSIKLLLFFNRNQYIESPGPFIMPDLKKPDAKYFVSKYFDIKDKQLVSKSNAICFHEDDDDEAVLCSFNRIYTEMMKEEFKKENPEFKNYIEQLDNVINKIDTINEEEKIYNKLRILYETEEFRDFCNGMCNPEYFYKELLKNGEVRKNLKNNFWIYEEFNNCFKRAESDYIQGEDYTFLILNAVKALEYLLYRKIMNYQDFKNSINDEITEKIMLDKMINYIKINRNIIRMPCDNVISKEHYKYFVESYFNLLIYVKDECRNGYFHKHRIDTYDSLDKKREKVLEAIAKTIVILK